MAAGLPSSVTDVLGDEVLTFLRRAERFHLGAVAAGDVAAALREPIEAGGRSIVEEALQVAVEGTQGYPFLIQLVGHQTWAANRSRKAITTGQARAGVEQASRRVGCLVHEPALSRLSAVDRSFLAAMAADDGPARMRDVAQRLGVSQGYASQYRLRLIAAELITSAGYGRVDFALPYLRDYLREHVATVALDGQDPH